MDFADIAHVNEMLALLVVLRHLAIVQRVADEVGKLDQIATAIKEMKGECAGRLRMHRRLDPVHRRHGDAPGSNGQSES